MAMFFKRYIVDNVVDFPRAPLVIAWSMCENEVSASVSHSHADSYHSMAALVSLFIFDFKISDN